MYRHNNHLRADRIEYYYPANFRALPMHERRAAYATAEAQLKAYRAKRKVEIEAEKADIARRSKTCQCCGGSVFAETGVIAHHGYTRPGDGWQTASCPGARHLPFEADRSVLALVIESYGTRIATVEREIHLVQTEASPVIVQAVDTTKPRILGKRQYTAICVTRDNFAEHKEIAYRTHYVHSFDQLLTREVAALNGHVDQLRKAKAVQEARYNNWTQTHEWIGDAWAEVK